MGEYQKPPKWEKKPKKPLARGNKPLKRVALRKCTKPLGKKPTERHREELKQDAKVNRKIWKTRPHECFECGQPLICEGKPPKAWFSHVLAKGGLHIDIRFDPENIVLHCRGCHKSWGEDGKRKQMKTYRLKLAYMVEHGYTEKEL